MPNKTVFITGASGVVGTVLMNGLTDFNVVGTSLAEHDLTNYESVKQVIPDDVDVLIHLAWKPGGIYENGVFDPANVEMALNVLEVAAEKKIPRVILASSVHAKEYRPNYKAATVISQTRPTSIYGATKVYVEEIGKYFAHYRNMQVISIRLGGVNIDDSVNGKDEEHYDAIYLSHKDLLCMFNKIINQQELLHDFTTLYAVSGIQQ
jgi:uronate dehydrogenase